MILVHMNKDEKMMIFERKLQSTTKSSHSYAAKDYVRLQPKRACLSYEYAREASLC